jgi:hypothetical protein
VVASVPFHHLLRKYQTYTPCRPGVRVMSFSLSRWPGLILHSRAFRAMLSVDYCCYNGSWRVENKICHVLTHVYSCCSVTLTEHVICIPIEGKLQWNQESYQTEAASQYHSVTVSQRL